MNRLVVDRLWPMLVGLVLLLAGALALQGYAAGRGNETIRVVVQDESVGAVDEESGEAATLGQGSEGPLSSPAHAQARLLARRGEFDKALPLLEAEARARPGDALLQAELGSWLLSAGEPRRALAALAQADRLAPTVDSALHLGQARARTGDEAGAEVDLRRALALRPGSSAARVALGALLLKRGNRAEAIGLLEQAAGAGSNLDRARALVALGSAYRADGRRADAERVFEQAILFAPARVEVRLGVARSWLAGEGKEDARRALAVLLKVADLAPDLPSVFVALGRARERLDEDPLAMEAYDRALRLDPGLRYARRRLIRLSLASRDFARARREAERLVADAPTVPEHHFLQALVADRDGRKEDARQAYRAAIAAAKGDYPEAYLNLGVLERNAGDFGKARAAYDAALKRRPAYAAAWLNIGKLLEAEKKPAEAEAAYLKALALEPRHVNGWVFLGQLRTDQKRWGEAEAALRKALEVRPSSVSALLSLGVVQARSQRLDEAVGTYRKVLEREPLLVSAHFDLGLALEQQGKVDEARAAFLRGLTADPGHLGSLRRLAELELAARRLPEARKALQDLLDAAPGDLGARTGLAELAALAGDRAGCESAARTLLREAPEERRVQALAPFCSNPRKP